MMTGRNSRFSTILFAGVWLLLCTLPETFTSHAFTTQPSMSPLQRLLRPLIHRTYVPSFSDIRNSPCRTTVSLEVSSASSVTSASSAPQPPTKDSRWLRIWSGSGRRPPPERPNWARPWMPTWLVTMRPALQAVTVLLLYTFHLVVLAQHALPFPCQLIPNDRGNFQSIGWDSLAGMATLGAYYYFQRTGPNAEISSEDDDDGEEANSHTTDSEDGGSESSAHPPGLPKLWSTPTLREMPWKNIYKSKYARLTSFLACCALFQAYFWTGRLSLWWEDTFYQLANYYPITVAMHRSLCVLMGHLSWIGLGGTVLRLIPRPQDFFQTTWYTQRYAHPSSDNGLVNGNKDEPTKLYSQWVWWTIGGYFVSSWLFNIADFVNQLVLPLSILEQAQESVVSQLINPEMNDWWASLVGYIAPCITAPWWEEVLYRGFLLPALVLQFKYKWAVLWSGIIFSVHHLSPTACIPLAVLGWTWSILYVKSGNLWTTILIHAMWNSRIFLGSWLGL